MYVIDDRWTLFQAYALYVLAVAVVVEELKVESSSSIGLGSRV